MPQVTTLGRTRVERAIGGRERITEPWTKDRADEFLRQLTETDSETYKDVASRLIGISREAVYTSGTTLSLDDLTPVIDKQPFLDSMDRQVARIKANPRLTPEQKQVEQQKEMVRTQKAIVNATYEEALRRGNPLAEQVRAKARGNKNQLTAILSTPGVYEDARGNVTPLFVRNSFSHGLSPREYWSSTPGARKSVIATKFATADAGYLGKQINSAIADIQVVEEECGATEGVGLPVPVGDEDNLGAVLAAPVAGFKPGTVITPEVLSKLQADHDDDILVRSPVTCRSKQGVCAHCAGHREKGGFPQVGERIGINAGAALAERIAQSSLNCLVEGTLVRMADMTERPIEQLRKGDWVLGADKEGNTFPAQVTAVWDQGMQPAQRYTYSLGGTKRRIHVDCTEIHPLLVTKKVSGAVYRKFEGDNCYSPDSFTPRVLPAGVRGNDVGAVMPVSCKVREAGSESLALLYGLLLGDGIRWDHTKFAHSNPRFSCADPSLIVELNRLLAPLGYRAQKRQRSHDYSLVADAASGFADTDPKTGQHVRTDTRHVIKAKLLAWGIAGKYAHEKEVCPGAYRWPLADVCALLAGYIASDGSVGVSKAGHPFVSFGSTSRPLLEGLRELLELRLCVYAGSISKTGKAGQGNRKHDMWQLHITRTDQIRKLARLLPRIPGVKGDRFLQLIDDTKDYPTVAADPFVRARRKAIEPLGDKQCYDISVDSPDSLFVLANGCIVHNTKHSGGQGGQKGDSDFQGFPYVEQFMQVPAAFSDAATLATKHGTVEEVNEAPQGGHYVTVGGEQHYVPANLTLRAKVGDKIYAGDALSGGLVNPKEVVMYKGIGEGRRYFTDRLMQMLKDSGYSASRRNVEVLARGLVNHVVNEELEDIGGALPGDVLEYSGWASGYAPRKDSVAVDPSKAVGQYLEAPALQYSIGTEITPVIANQLKKFGHNRVMAHASPPGIKPHMPALREVPQYQPDWMAQLGSNYLKKNLLRNAHQGAVSNTLGRHPLPRVAAGTITSPVVKDYHRTANITDAHRVPGKKEEEPRDPKTVEDKKESEGAKADPGYSKFFRRR